MDDAVGPEGLAKVASSRAGTEVDWTLILLCMFRGLGLAARLVQAVRPLGYRLKEVIETSSGTHFIRVLPQLRVVRGQSEAAGKYGSSLHKRRPATHPSTPDAAAVKPSIPPPSPGTPSATRKRTASSQRPEPPQRSTRRPRLQPPPANPPHTPPPASADGTPAAADRGAAPRTE